MYFHMDFVIINFIGGIMRVFMLTILLLFIFTGCNVKTNTNITTNFESGIFPLNTRENSLPLTIASPQLDISQIDLDNNQLLDNITDFCSSPRKSGTPEEDQAVDFLVSKMSEYGYQSTTQIFNTYEKNMSEIWGGSSLNDYFYKFTGDDNACYRSKNIIATKSVEGTV